MNGYQMHSQAYKDYLEKHPDIEAEVRADIESKIKALDFLADSTRAERLELFNSSAFNDVTRGYLKMAIDNTELEDETGKRLLRELSYLFDTVTAGQAEDYYNSH